MESRTLLPPAAIAAALALLQPLARCDVELPAILGDGMVVQQRTRVAFWGRDAPLQEVRVTPSWSAEAVAAAAGVDGKWRVWLETPGAGGPFTIEVRGSERVVLDDVWAGEVWVCSGQSNMEMPVDDAGPGYTGVLFAEQEIAAAQYPALRLFNVQNAYAGAPRAGCQGAWAACSPETLPGFSATGYFFGRDLHLELGVPVGLIGANWGGTVAESWTSERALWEWDAFAGVLARRAWKGADDELDVNSPAALFNGMIAPIAPYGIRGAVWYQGESNRPRAHEYRALFPGMIEDWRRTFGRPGFPFYFVQIAPYEYRGDRGEAAELREAQALALALPGTGMAVTMDIGDPADIHPKNKQEVGRRLALCALRRTYGRDVEDCGPTYRSMSVEGGAVRLAFDHAEGLDVIGPAPTHFTIAGADRRFVPADAAIDGLTIVVRSAEVPEPVAVRFAWGPADEPNLFNGAGLPAPSFRTDDWPCVTERR